MADKQDDKTEDSSDVIDEIASKGPAVQSPITPPPTKEEAISKSDDKLPSEATIPPVVVPTEETLISAPAADAAPASASTPTPANPVVVTEPEVEQKSPASGNGEKLAEEIEVLTGEIQALEAKIEQLTNGASTITPSTPAMADIAPIAQTPSPTEAAPKTADTASETPVPNLPPPPAAPSNDVDFVNKPKDDAGQSVPVNTPPKTSSMANDFFPNAPQPKVSSAPANVSNEAGGEESSQNNSGLAIIGEVVAIFGVVIFVVLAVSPFFREVVGEDTYLAIQQIGWLSALGTLGLGWIMLLFVKGKGFFKWLVFVLLLLAIVLFLAINENSLISPISDYLEPLLEFYR